MMNFIKNNTISMYNKLLKTLHTNMRYGFIRRNECIKNISEFYLNKDFINLVLVVYLGVTF